MLSGDGAVDGIGLRRGGCRGVVLRPPRVAASGHPGDADGIGHLAAKISAAARPPGQPEHRMDRTSVVRRRRLLRHSKISRPAGEPFGVAELVPAGCFLWSPRLLSQGTGDKLIVHCDPWSFARADTASAVGHRWSNPRPGWQPNQAHASAWEVLAVAAGSSLSPGVAWWWPLRAQLTVRGGCSAWRGVAGPDPAGASLPVNRRPHLPRLPPITRW